MATLTHSPARTRIALALGLLIAGLMPVTGLHAHTKMPDEGRWLRLEVIDRDAGRALPQHRHRRQAWVVGEDSQPYTLRLTNLGGERLLVVLSVDGINVVSGETADPSQTGYVLAPWATADIEGWRKSMSDVAAFRFSAAEHSYGGLTGRPNDLGVIGAAVFREARPAPELDRIELYGQRERAQAKGSADAMAESAAPAAAPLGTAHGERRWSPTTHTAFERASRRPSEILQLRYDRFEALVARGVIRHRAPRFAHEPRAFPSGFVPDP